MWTHSTGPVETTLGPQCPQSRWERRSPTLSSMSSITPIHHSQDPPQEEGPLAEAPPFNVSHHVLPWSPLVLIQEHLHITGFSLTLSLTLYGPLGCDALSIYTVTSPAREAPSAFMQPLNQLMHTRLAAPCTPFHEEGLPSFRAPYPLANPLTAPTMFIHSPNPHLITRDNSLASVTHTSNPVEEEYLHTLQSQNPHYWPYLNHDQCTPHLLRFWSQK